MTREEAINALSDIDRAWRNFSQEEYVALEMAIKALEHPEQNVIAVVPCGDAISRKSIKQKLQEHHDFFVNAYGEFSNLPQHDKSRVDEITNCIAMVVNEPPVNPQPKTGHWVEHPEIETSTPEYLMFYECSECGDKQCFCKSDIHKKRFCGNCGCRMIEPQESEGKK